MSNVKKIIIAISIIVVIITICTISGIVIQKRADKIYTELETGYNNLRDTNKKLRDINDKLDINNIRLREKVTGINGDIRRANIIVGEFEESISGARNTIDRIKITVGFIEQIVEQLPEEIIILEENDIIQ